MAKKIECRDCKKALTPVVSNIKSPNEHRILFYSCDECQKKDGIPKTVVIMRRPIKAKDERTFNNLVIEFILSHVKK